MPSEPDVRVTQILQAIQGGDLEARDDLLPLLYSELRTLAAAQMSRVAPGQTLQATALVHEAYLRLFGGKDPGFENRRHFLFAAARAMHDILVEQARRKAALRRGGAWKRTETEHLVLAIEAPAEDMLALDEALTRLEKDDLRKYQIVQLRFFAGLTAEETAEALEISLRTVEREWSYIRARLHQELSSPDH